MGWLGKEEGGSGEGGEGGSGEGGEGGSGEGGEGGSGEGGEGGSGEGGEGRSGEGGERRSATILSPQPTNPNTHLVTNPPSSYPPFPQPTTQSPTHTPATILSLSQPPSHPPTLQLPSFPSANRPTHPIQPAGISGCHNMEFIVAASASVTAIKIHPGPPRNPHYFFLCFFASSGRRFIARGFVLGKSPTTSVEETKPGEKKSKVQQRPEMRRYVVGRDTKRKEGSEGANGDLPSLSRSAASLGLPSRGRHPEPPKSS
ncbi:hypothetical protein Pmani_002421 [Petrolisthes manimaculis]|uniref:Uncharacterized protein n=1 Tax=Petrolisthes manimaculis TaxID=1843537 RepID=A0AAE1UQH3_9EUCA|nr:hypothetical protein Pmani_002421 [Petrolisthes manimaculis]